MFNKALASARLNNHLYAQVDKQRREVDFLKQARSERPPA